ncbi:hypothetical protein Goarm_023255 [Gossypium armourianum]|uniref:Uncharacterized protein n=1 Tax=Gossypium armourianum TaxID=34283 RepID=A0A7J9KII9_9ROSI|nr:hypothetical protein [Gossypium armourianum]
MPRCRFGFIHVINNGYNHRFLYAIGDTSNLQLSARAIGILH